MASSSLLSTSCWGGAGAATTAKHNRHPQDKSRTFYNVPSFRPTGAASRGVSSSSSSRVRAIYDRSREEEGDHQQQSVGRKKQEGDATQQDFDEVEDAAAASTADAAAAAAAAGILGAEAMRRHMEDARDLRERLTTSMDAAVTAEDFTLAAKLRDELHEANARDPLYVTNARLRVAVAEERYEEAAALRDEIVALTPPPAPPPPPTPSTMHDDDDDDGGDALAPPRLPCESDVTTHGVNVRVLSQHVASRSDPEAGRYFFAYSVRITNESDAIVQLRDRAWEVTDGRGRVDVVRGPGVIGQQPVLLPGQTFEYASACPLATSRGVMRGSYTFVKILTEEAGGAGQTGGDVEGAGALGGAADEGLTVIAEGDKPEFEVEVGAFGLDAELGAFKNGQYE